MPRIDFQHFGLTQVSQRAYTDPGSAIARIIGLIGPPVRSDRRRNLWVSFVGKDFVATERSSFSPSLAACDVELYTCSHWVTSKLSFRPEHGPWFHRDRKSTPQT